MRNEILTEDHKYWDALGDRLLEWLNKDTCDCTNNKTKRILWSLEKIDVNETLYYLTNYTCLCDCKIYDKIVEIKDLSNHKKNYEHEKV